MPDGNCSHIPYNEQHRRGLGSTCSSSYHVINYWILPYSSSKYYASMYYSMEKSQYSLVHVWLARPIKVPHVTSKLAHEPLSSFAYIPISPLV